jgi:hypothetical protein
MNKNLIILKFSSIRKTLFILLFSFSNAIYAQTLTVSSNQMSFGNVFENSPDSMQLTISNNTGRNINVTNIHFYNTYGTPAFSTSNTWFTVNDNSSVNIWVKFSPRHNIFHNSQMVIENDGLRGFITVDLRGQGKYSNHYYDLTEDIVEENLKTVLGVITGNGYVSLGYNVARDSMFMRIDNKKINGQGATQNTLECIYTGRQAVGYTDRADCQTNNSFNTEHTLPQSLFSSNEPMRSDLHHLFPTDDNANNERGDNPFGVVANPTWSNGGSFSDGNTFEPRDLQKGATARALFYFILRYQNYNGFVTPQENILRTWFWNFPPTAVEKKRNSDISSVQHNRNPFVDYPEFLERIHSMTSTSSAPVVSSVDLPEDTIIYGTIPTNTNVTYNYVIVNDGNIPLSLSNFSLTHPAELSFTSGANDTTLSPGDGINVQITCNTPAPDSIRAFLTFNTNSPGHFGVSVPVFVNDSIYTSISENEYSFNIYPNPAHESITISRTNKQNEKWYIFNLTGKNVADGTGDKIETGNFIPGVYFLKVGNIHKLFVIE